MTDETPTAHALCHCPACRVQSTAHLLETGRPRMALTMLEELPVIIAEAIEIKDAERKHLAAEIRELSQRIAARRQELRQLERAIVSRKRTVGTATIRSKPQQLAEAARHYPPLP